MQVFRTVLSGVALSVLAFAAATPASARNLYFDMWCQEQGYDKARCDARNQADVEAFEAYWRAVEKFEEPFYYERQEYGRFRDTLNALDEAPEPGIANYEPEKAQRPY